MHNITKDNPVTRETRSKPYCFPNIPLDNLSNKMERLGKGKDFQRSDFGKDGKSSNDFFEVSPVHAEFRVGTKGKSVEIEKQAYARGFVQGEKAGMESGRKKVEPVLSNFHQALLELDRIKNEISHNAEKETVDLAMAIARKIVGCEVVTNRNVVLDVVKEALKKVVDEDKIVIRINPSEFNFVKDAKLQFSDYVDHIENITIEEDDTISNGGCVIETNLGEIDARIEKQLQALEEAFKSQLQESR